MNMETQSFILPSVEEKLAVWRQFLQDQKIDPTIDAFIQAVVDQIAAFRSETPMAKIAYHSHMHMEKGMAICYTIGDAHHLWMSVFPDTDEHKNHRATVCMARRSLQAKVDGSVICAKPSDAAIAIIGEIKRVCKLLAQ